MCKHERYQNFWLLGLCPRHHWKAYSIPQAHSLSLWLIGTVRAEPETVISRAWVQSPDPAE